jgi:uncharacterized protein YkwD
MWNKPSELTSYAGYGYEIALQSSVGASAKQALERWKGSPGHHACIINKGIWKQPWQAIGICIFEGYALVWFGHAKE